jgi:hypothetical protein
MDTQAISMCFLAPSEGGDEHAIFAGFLYLLRL